MKIAFIILLLNQLVMAQPRPTGNVLTDNETDVIFQKISEKEIKLTKLLNDHIKKCYPSFDQQKSLIAILAHYHLLNSESKSEYFCTADQLSCLQKTSSETKGLGFTIIKNKDYKEYLIKHHKLKPYDADKFILEIKKWLEIETENEREKVIYNKS